MPVYSYNAVTLDGKKKSGTLEAENPQKLAERLRDMDLYVSDFKVKGGSKTLTKSKLKATDLSDMCRQIGTMVGSGVVIARAVDIIRSRQGIDKNIKEIYDGLYNSLRQGMSLSEAMADQGNTFQVYTSRYFDYLQDFDCNYTSGNYHTLRSCTSYFL